MHRSTTLLVLCFPLLLSAQCLWFTGHPFGTCTQGNIALSTCPTGFDSVVWSNGYVGMWNTGLPPGDHSYVVYDGGSAIGMDTLTVEQLEWSFMSVQMVPMGAGFAITGWAEVPWCGTSALNAPCCMPDPATTYIRLLQDGITEITTTPCVACDNFPCYGTSFMFLDVPGGHTYQVRLHDLSCGVTVTDTNTFFVPLTTGIAEGSSTADAEGLISVQEGILMVPTSERTSGPVQFFDGVGRPIQLLQLAPGTFDTGSLTPGVYLVSVPADGAPRTYRFIR